MVQRLVFLSATVATLSLVLLTGCVSRSTADTHARAAYLAGQRDAIAQMNQGQQPAGTNTVGAFQNLPSNVTLIGPVEHPIVPWQDGLTLASAIVNAVYASPVDPTVIIIRRSNEEIQVDPARLLSGSDFPLRPGDIVHLQLPKSEQ